MDTQRIEIPCRAPGCTTVYVAEEAVNRMDAVDQAFMAAWCINQHERGLYEFCPEHAEQFRGKTPSGRTLIHGYTWSL